MKEVDDWNLSHWPAVLSSDLALPPGSSYLRQIVEVESSNKMSWLHHRLAACEIRRMIVSGLGDEALERIYATI